MAVGADELITFQRELDAARTALETEGSVVRSNPFDVLMSGTQRRGASSNGRGLITEGAGEGISGAERRSAASSLMESLPGPNNDFGNPRITARLGEILEKDMIRGIRNFDYRNGFLEDLVSFRKNTAQLHNGLLTEDLCIVRYYNSTDRIKYNWWTHIEVSSGRDARELLNRLGVLRYWGEKDMLDIALIPRGTGITFISGKAVNYDLVDGLTGMVLEEARGGLFQIRFRDFDPNWIQETIRLRGGI